MNYSQKEKCLQCFVNQKGLSDDVCPTTVHDSRTPSLHRKCRGARSGPVDRVSSWTAILARMHGMPTYACYEATIAKEIQPTIIGENAPATKTRQVFMTLLIERRTIGLYYMIDFPWEATLTRKKTYRPDSSNKILCGTDYSCSYKSCVKIGSKRCSSISA